MNRTISSAELAVLLENHAELTVLDLRRTADFEADAFMVPGARWLDPGAIDDWSTTLPRDREIVLYCAHGKSISNAALDKLLALGIKARFIEGGMDGWKDAGRALAAKP